MPFESYQCLKMFFVSIQSFFTTHYHLSNLSLEMKGKILPPLLARATIGYLVYKFISQKYVNTPLKLFFQNVQLIVVGKTQIQRSNVCAQVPQEAAHCRNKAARACGCRGSYHENVQVDCMLYIGTVESRIEKWTEMYNAISDCYHLII